VAAAIEEAWSERGVLVLMDLGSALLSAEMAVELLPEEHRKRVLLSAAPLVEGAVAAAVTSRLGEPLERVEREAIGSLDAKRAQVGGPGEGVVVPAAEPDLGGPVAETRIAVDIPLGLPARPAARVIRATAGLNAQVLAGNATTGPVMVNARSLNALAGLQVREGHELVLHASGRPGELQGIPASSGIAIATLQFLEEADLAVPDTEVVDPPAELEALELAVTATRHDLEELRDQTRTRSGSYEAEILDADLLFLEDPD